MPNLSQIKRERMMAFLQKLKDEHRDDDEMLIALGEIESELNAKKYGLVWEKHEEAVDVMMQNHIPVFTEVPEREIVSVPENRYNFIFEFFYHSIINNFNDDLCSICYMIESFFKC